MRQILSYILFFILALSADAQVRDSAVLKVAEALHQKGVQFFRVDMDSAVVYIQQAKLNYKEAQYWDGMVSSLNDISFIYYYQNKFSKFKKNQDLALREAQKYLLPESPTYATAVNNLNIYYYTIGNYTQSIKLIKEALKSIEKKEANLGLVTLYQNLANAYRRNGDYLQSLNYLNRSLESTLDTLSSTHYLVGNIYQDMGRVYKDLLQTDSAFYYLEKSLAIFEEGTEAIVFGYKMENLLLLSDLWTDQGDLAKAKKLIHRVLKASRDKRPYEEVHGYENLGEVYIKDGKYELGISFLEKAMTIASAHKKRHTPPLVARRYLKIADALRAQEKWRKALANYQKALVVLAPEFEQGEDFKNPSVDQILAPKEALGIFEKKAQTFWALYQDEGQLDFLQASYSTYLTSTKIIQNLRKGILTIEAKNILSEKTIPVYEGAIRTAVELYDKTKEQKYLEKAFFLAESNKALLLLENINEQAARGISGLPDSLLEKEKELKLNLAFLQKSLLENKGAKDVAKKNRQEIFSLHRELDQLHTFFEREFPKYYEAKYQNDPIDLASLQNMLGASKSTLLEYFVGEESIYLFMVKEDQLKVLNLDEPLLVLDAIRRIRFLLNQVKNDESTADDYHQFTGVAHDLYQWLLGPVLPEAAGPLVQSLIIIPDNLLNYIPFDILLQREAGEGEPSYSPSQLDYVLKNYSISYDYSATLHIKNQQRKREEYSIPFLGFAPNFKDAGMAADVRSCDENQLYNLKCSREEVGAINEIMKGKIQLDRQASRAHFLEKSSGSRILHLATHACIDEAQPMNSKIFLSDDYLTNFDLYNLNLKAELAVLSACNTGSGKLVKGEGVMSLARGFISAGCASSVVSIWSANDCATSAIMRHFYSHLHAGKAKHEALRLAKLDFLAEADKSQSHPYYWAAFVAFGDSSPMFFPGSFSWTMLVGFVLVLLVVFYFVRRWFTPHIPA